MREITFVEFCAWVQGKGAPKSLVLGESVELTFPDDSVAVFTSRIESWGCDSCGTDIDAPTVEVRP